MPLFGEFAGARAIAPEKSGAVQLSKTIGHLVGTTSVVVTKPGDERTFTVRAESGTIRIRPDRYDGFEYIGGDVDTGAETITETAHGYTTGEGPFQVTVRQAELTALTSIVIDDVADTFTRTVGSFLDEGFIVGHTITVANSASNNGDFTIGAVTATVITVTEDITVLEGAQTDLTITAPGTITPDLALLTNYWLIVVDTDTLKVATSLANALADIDVNLTGGGSGRLNIGGPAGWGANDVAAASVSNGYGSLRLAAGDEISFAAPERITLVGIGASDACSYWWGR